MTSNVDEWSLRCWEGSFVGCVMPDLSDSARNYDRSGLLPTRLLRRDRRLANSAALVNTCWELDGQRQVLLDLCFVMSVLSHPFRMERYDNDRPGAASTGPWDGGT
jgi:hypothetical protein